MDEYSFYKENGLDVEEPDEDASTAKEKPRNLRDVVRIWLVPALGILAGIALVVASCLPMATMTVTDNVGDGWIGVRSATGMSSMVSAGKSMEFSLWGNGTSTSLGGGLLMIVAVVVILAGFYMRSVKGAVVSIVGGVASMVVLLQSLSKLNVTRTPSGANLYTVTYHAGVGCTFAVGAIVVALAVLQYFLLRRRDAGAEE